MTLESETQSDKTIQVSNEMESGTRRGYVTVSLRCKYCVCLAMHTNAHLTHASVVLIVSQADICGRPGNSQFSRLDQVLSLYLRYLRNQGSD
ncbi:hypothetical protein PC123_g23442 [Phytophthora cactorum]|nr:hypothetical protein PC123_g23442 [Phytophthora cactorum]